MNPLIHKRIVNAIDGQLASKGWTKAESAPNAIVVYYAALDEPRQLNAWGNGPRWGGSGTVKEETILIGQLVVDIYDASTEQLLWRGDARDTATDNPGKNEKKMNEAVAKLFKEIAPRFQERLGGYTRVIKRHERRLGDGGRTAFLELLKEGETKVRVRQPQAPTAPRVETPVAPATPPPAPAPETAQTPPATPPSETPPSA